MHNRKKLEKPLTEEELAALAKKKEVYGSLTSLILQKRSSGDYSAETLMLLGKMLRNNPDVYSLWNFRREILLTMHPGLEDCSATSGNLSSENEVSSEELTVSADAIMRNPKCYGAWYHRQWIIDHFVVDYNHELELCKEFLLQDQRNFHCWNYRRFVVKRMGRSAQEEVDFATDKIQENFSNYSAFHHRSHYLLLRDDDVRNYLEEELSIVENAVFTEPDDQSAWWYHQFLMRLVQNKLLQEDIAANSERVAWFSQVTRKQLDLMRGLLEMEDGCRWVMICIISLIDLASSALVGGTWSVQDLRAEKAGLVRRLIDTDPMHRQRYLYLMKQGPL